MVVNAATAATLVFVNTTGGSMSGSGTYINPSSNQYYKCSNSFTAGCSGFAAARISYSSRTSGSGTSSSPYVLTNCSISACLCDYTVVYTSSGCGSACSYGLRATPVSATGDAQYHQNTACNYCGYNNYVYSFSPAPGVTVKQCNTCPNGGTSDGTGDITSCCLAANWTGSDEKGPFKCGSSACYQN